MKTHVSYSLITELPSPNRCDLLHHFAVAIAAVAVQPIRQLRKIEIVLHHETHRVLQAVVTLIFEQLVLDEIEQLAYRILLCRQRIEERLQLFAAQLFEIFDLAFAQYRHKDRGPRLLRTSSF